MGGGSNIEYTQSPEQQQMLRMFMPMISKMAAFGLGNDWNQQAYTDSTKPKQGMSPAQMDARGLSPGMMGGQEYPSGPGSSQWDTAFGQWGNYTGKFGERSGYGRTWAVPGAWADEDEYNYGMGNSYSTAPGMPWGTGGGADWYY